MSTLKRLHAQARARRQGKPGFTLLELIVVLLVLGILAAIAVPTFNRVKENSVTRVAQTTLEAIDRNGEAIAISDQNMSDEQVAAAVLAEMPTQAGLTITRSGAEIVVENSSGSIVASGTVTFSDGLGTIVPATVGGSGGGSGSSSTTSTTAAPTTTTVAPVSYSVGDTGPAGGVIFYVAPTPFACGPTLASTCTYLEAAPSDGNDGWAVPWCDVWTTFLGATATAIGTGMANTTTADLTCDGSWNAISLAANYTYGGYSDWFLPSKDELNQLYLQQTTVGGFTINAYMSSSEINFENYWAQHFGSGGQLDHFTKVGGFRYRPVRAF